MKKIFLHNNWFFKQADSVNWQNAIVPGNVHLDLLYNKIIPDPYFRDNEIKQQWIGENDWEYRTNFHLAENFFNEQNIDLVFEGLDTYADVYLNDVLIFSADNMYYGWRVPVKKNLKTGSNELKIYFHSVIKKTLPLFESNGFEYGANNSQPEPKLSVYSRKPGFHFGWDWGPRLLTCGVWRPVYLHAWRDCRICDVKFIQKSIAKNSAELRLEIEIESFSNLDVDLKLLFPGTNKSNVDLNAEVNPGKNFINLDFEIENPKLWWCNGKGEPYLYNLQLDLYSEDVIIDSWNQKVGLRTIELVHRDDEFGKSFYFVLNGEPVFIKGSNFLPPDYFIPRIKSEDYERLLSDAVNVNMNMLRLWGGAIYEEKIFYELCDEKGVLVWQDFMFACAMYPADETMKRRITLEAEYNVKRIRNHACVAIWCGNNEIDEGWHTWGWQSRYNYSNEACDKIWNYYLDIFHDILPNTVKEFDGQRNYWPSSPKYGFVDERSRSDGDMHYWGVWFLNHPKEKFNEFLPRFMSEYGLQSMPEISAFKKFSNEGDWNLKSDVMLSHQRQYPNPKKNQFLGGYDMLLKYLEREYHVPADFELLAYASQILQADYLKYAIEVHRRNKPYCMGTMYWQMNDVWPVTSWATVDYYGNWKAAHYAVKKSYADLIVSVAEEMNILKIFIVNDSKSIYRGILEVSIIDFSGNKYYERIINIEVKSETSEVFFEIDKKSLPENINFFNAVMISKLKVGNSVSAENLFYFRNTKELLLQKPEFNFTLKEDGKTMRLLINSRVLIKNLFIKTSATEFTDNYFDLPPNSDKEIIFKPKENWDGNVEFISYFDVVKNSSRNL